MYMKMTERIRDNTLYRYNADTKVSEMAVI